MDIACQKMNKSISKKQYRLMYCIMAAIHSTFKIITTKYTNHFDYNVEISIPSDDDKQLSYLINHINGAINDTFDYIKTKHISNDSSDIHELSEICESNLKHRNELISYIEDTIYSAFDYIMRLYDAVCKSRLLHSRNSREKMLLELANDVSQFISRFIWKIMDMITKTFKSIKKTSLFSFR